MEKPNKWSFVSAPVDHGGTIIEQLRHEGYKLARWELHTSSQGGEKLFLAFRRDDNSRLVTAFGKALIDVPDAFDVLGKVAARFLERIGWVEAGKRFGQGDADPEAD